MGPRAMRRQLLVHLMGLLRMRRRSLLLWMEGPESLLLWRCIVSQIGRAGGRWRRARVLCVRVRRVPIGGRLRISRGRMARVGHARGGLLVRVPWLCRRLLVRGSGRVVGSLPLPVRRVVVIAWVARVAWIAWITMVLMADCKRLVPRPSSAVIRMCWVRPAAFTQREGPFSSLPLPLVRVAIPFHRVSIIVAHRLQARPLGVIFHRVRGRSHWIFSSSIHIIGCGGPTVVERPRGRRTRERLWLAARPRWDAMGGHSRVSALIMRRRSSMILRRPVSLHLGSIVASSRRSRGAASGIVRSRLVWGLRSPKRREVCSCRVHSRGRVDRRAIRRARRGCRRRRGVVRLRLRGLSESRKATAEHRRD